ncbi:PGF-CTERM sorting domain-containing protein [Methanogenium sp. MK-MG]|uniref:PGF-CTERM sorting domain-containing protein n=1 Tax=Methanogenium sp. MK-MG TaxID=2599926 RepID=UPI0013E9C0A7|nr:PGF-CTERM sorting domain-containing protein [Methanogenium sp. MK-MG]KAF1076389.1 hypothetical protein MKMG_01525 [Methanogenium sp. MK-MG]
MTDRKTIISKILLAFLVAALICVPVNAHEESADDVTVEVGEIAEHSDELFASAESILLDTKAIVKDDTVDQEIRDLAKTIHLVSHELEDIAAGLQEDSAQLQELTTDPVANKAAIEELIVEMQASVAEYVEKLDGQHENIHDLVFAAPESREDNADAIHDAAHKAGEVAEHIIEHTEELQGMLSGTSAAAVSTPSSQTPCVNTADVTVEVGEIAEHSDELFSSAESILLDTKAIVKDDTVDQDIRDLAKTIHLVSHELEDIAADMQENSAELQTLAVDPKANKAVIEGIIVEMEASSADYLSKLESQHENIHELVFIAPESREGNADAVHDAAHEAESVAGHLTEHISGLSAALDAPSDAPAAQTSAGAEATKSPGFGVLAAIGGICCSMAYLARRQ